jgi:hypothetical protein
MSDQSFVGAILGARRSGKTSLATDMLRGLWTYRFDMVIILSRTIPLQLEFLATHRWHRYAGHEFAKQAEGLYARTEG